MNHRPIACRILGLFGVMSLLMSSFAHSVRADAAAPNASKSDARRPNILLAIADDASFAHTSKAGCRAINTPAFDRVANEGVFFRNGFAASPGCSPSRAALLTGLHHWQIEHAGTHASEFATKYVTYADALEKAGYHVGYTGKGWSPGNFKVSGRTRNPAGDSYGAKKAQPPYSGISNNDYAGNFADFLAKREKDEPFCFWYGATEPHRGFEKGSGLKAGKKLEDVEVPPFLPDAPEVRSDILDYLVEIEHFDTHLGRMLDMLEKAGELDNTIVIVTADNGMAFPAAKANCWEYGIHVPLAVRWGAAGGKAGRTVDDVVGFVDLSATIYDAAGVKPPLELSGKSLVSMLKSDKSGLLEPGRISFSGRERHSSSRVDNLTYPQRSVRGDRYLYIRNFAPDRWPAGDPQVLNSKGEPGPMHGAYHDIDACPTLSYMVANRKDPAVAPLFKNAVGKRPAEELYDIVADPGCLKNLAADDQHTAAKAEMSGKLDAELKRTNDARVTGNGDVWETYKRYSPIRSFPPPPETLPE